MAHLLASYDQAGDGFNAGYGLVYLKDCNYDAIYDPSHGIDNDVDNSFIAVDRYSLCLLLMVVLNFMHGPEKDEGLRWRQIKECVDVMFNNFNPDSFALLQALGPQMLKELGDRVATNNPDAPLRDLWTYLREGEAFANKKTVPRTNSGPVRRKSIAPTYPRMTSL